MKTAARLLTAGLIAMTLITPAMAQEKVLLQYKFDEGETLQYRTESHDSTSQGSGENATTMQMTRWSLLSMSVPKKKSDSYEIVVQVDSTWNDDSDGTMTSESGGRRMVIRRGPGGPGGRRGPQEFEMKPNGQSAGREEIATPIILPLPDEPVAMNETWDFEKNIKRRGRMSGTTRVTGQCLLYDFEEQEGRTVALIIVNSESTGEGQFKFQRPGQVAEISGSTQSKGATTSLVYFDIDAGRITEIVTEETRDSVTESSMFSSNMTMKSTSTIKLISE